MGDVNPGQQASARCLSDALAPSPAAQLPSPWAHLHLQLGEHHLPM